MSKNASGADNQQERLSKLSPDYVVGLVDGEGYFSVSASIDRSKSYTSYRVRVVFGVKLKESDREILERLKYTFGCGSLRKRLDNRPTFSNCVEYQARDFEDIKTIIIPFFQRYPLQIRSKRSSFEKFVQIAELFDQKVHLSITGFKKLKTLAKQVHR